MDPREVRAVHAALQSLSVEKQGAEAAALVARLGTCSAVDLNSVEFVDLWWTFCEELADAVAQSDPTCAARLYDLALVSCQKEGSYATGSGEGLMAMGNIRRVQEKLAAVAPPPASAMMAVGNSST